MKTKKEFYVSNKWMMEADKEYFDELNIVIPRSMIKPMLAALKLQQGEDGLNSIDTLTISCYGSYEKNE